MIVLAVEARLLAPFCRSLKDKRALVKPLLSRLRQTFNASAVESASQDHHSHITLTIAALAFDSAQADSIQENLYRFIESNTEAELIGWDVEYR